MASIEHFEIPAGDLERARRFYETVFGFRYEPWGDGMGMLMTGSEKGINGDLHARGEVAHPTIVVSVERIEDTLEAVIANGGEQLGEIQPLGETARWVYVRDSEGNAIGLYDDSAE